MGQKLSEHPQTDWWVKLTREADATGVGGTLPTRSVDTRTDYGRWEMDRFATMQRLRFRSVNWMERTLGDPPRAAQVSSASMSCACSRCGRAIGKRSTRKRLVRQVWERDGSRRDYYICGRC